MLDAARPQPDFWRERDMARVARCLHDRVGPALCAAGLHLSLLKESVKAPSGSDAAASLAGLRQALDESTQEIRTLSYLCDPSLVARLGLKAAIGYLARSAPLDVGELGALGARRDSAAAAVFYVLRQSLLFWSECCQEADFALMAGSKSLKLAASIPAPDEVAALASASGGVVSKNRLTVTFKVGGAKRGGLE